MVQRCAGALVQRCAMIDLQVLQDSGFLSNGQLNEGRDGERGGGGGARGLLATIQAHSEHAKEPCLVNAMLVAGLFPNVAAVTRRGKQPPKCVTDEDGKVGFHPSSIMMDIEIPRHGCVPAHFTFARAAKGCWISLGLVTDRC